MIRTDLKRCYNRTTNPPPPIDSAEAKAVLAWFYANGLPANVELKFANVDVMGVYRYQLSWLAYHTPDSLDIEGLAYEWVMSDPLTALHDLARAFGFQVNPNLPQFVMPVEAKPEPSPLPPPPPVVAPDPHAGEEMVVADTPFGKSIKWVKKA